MGNGKNVECFQCSKTFYSKDATLAMGLGEIGEFYWCRDCLPPAKSADEVIGQMDRFINPKKELPDDA